MPDLQRTSPIGTDWEPPKFDPELAGILLSINIPDHARVRRNTITNVVEISDLRLSDLISLRDALGEQISKIARGEGWEEL